MKTSFMIVTLLLFQSCFKTAEEIKREKRIDKHVSNSSKIIADLRIEIQELKSQLASATGQIEEIDYKTQTSGQETYQSMSEKVIQLQEQVKALTEENRMTQVQLSELSNSVNKQKKYINKVTGTLSELSGSDSGDLLARANQAFTKNKQKKARELYLEVLAQNKINNATKNRVYYNLGLLDYWAKNYDQSLVYFSKIYTKYPRSSKAAGSLYYIGLNFKKKNEKEKANATFQELINNYPKSVFVPKAKKEL